MFLSIVDKHAPLRTMRVRARSSPWITSELKKRMHNRNILKIKAIRSKDPFDWMQFKKQRNIVNNEIRLAKQSYYHNSFNEYKVGNIRKKIKDFYGRKFSLRKNCLFSQFTKNRFRRTFLKSLYIFLFKCQKLLLKKKNTGSRV